MPPLLLLLNAPRWLWDHRDEVAWGLVIVLSMLLYCAAVKLRALGHELALRPRVEEHVIVHHVQGPTRIVTRIVTRPGGERIVERIRTVESAETTRSDDRLETPAEVPWASLPRWYAGGSAAPQGRRRPWVRAGTTIGGRLDLGLSYAPEAVLRDSWRFEAAWRF